MGQMLTLYGENAGPFKRYCIFCSDGGDIQSSWGWFKRHNYTREVFAGLLRQHIKEIEGSQGPVKANGYLLLNDL